MPNTTTSMLNSLAQILETDGWDSMKEAGAELVNLEIYGDHMLFTMTNRVGVTKRFRVTEEIDS